MRRCALRNRCPHRDSSVLSLHPSRRHVHSMARPSRSTVPRADPSGLAPAASAITSYGTTPSFGEGRSIRTAMTNTRTSSGNGCSHHNQAMRRLTHGQSHIPLSFAPETARFPQPTTSRDAPQPIQLAACGRAKRTEVSADSRTDHSCTTRLYSGPIHVWEHLTGCR